MTILAALQLFSSSFHDKLCKVILLEILFFHPSGVGRSANMMADSLAKKGADREVPLIAHIM